MAAWVVVALFSVLIVGYFDFDWSTFLCATLMVPVWIFDWFASLDLVKGINLIGLPTLVLALFILIVVKIKFPNKEDK